MAGNPSSRTIVAFYWNAGLKNKQARQVAGLFAAKHNLA